MREKRLRENVVARALFSISLSILEQPRFLFGLSRGARASAAGPHPRGSSSSSQSLPPAYVVWRRPLLSGFVRPLQATAVAAA